MPDFLPARDKITISVHDYANSPIAARLQSSGHHFTEKLRYASALKNFVLAIELQDDVVREQDVLGDVLIV